MHRAKYVGALIKIAFSFRELVQNGRLCTYKAVYCMSTVWVACQ